MADKRRGQRHLELEREARSAAAAATAPTEKAKQEFLAQHYAAMARVMPE